MTEFDKANNTRIQEADDDEPLFVIQARDIGAPYILQQWADMVVGMGGAEARAMEAIECAHKMIEWRNSHPDREEVPGRTRGDGGGPISRTGGQR